MNGEDDLNLKAESKKIFNFFISKKGQWILIGALLLTVIIFGSWFRVQNLPLLKDSTSGEYIPLALDPFYFLRVAETIVNNEGILPEVDTMRYPSLKMGFTKELTPRAVVFLYRILNTFDKSATLQFADVIFPVVFFALGMLAFFFLVYALTNSKWIAISSSIFLSVTPAYLYRTMAGFSDHESIGMFAFFTTMMVYSLSIKYLEKEKVNLFKTVLFSAGIALLTVFTFASWGGVARFVFMTIPLSFFLIWIIKFKREINFESMKTYFLFYFLWVVLTIFLGSFRYGFSLMMGNFIGFSGIIGAFVFVFVAIDFFLYYLESKNYLKKDKIKNYRILYSIAGAIALGVIILPLIKGNPFQLASNIWKTLLQPFGADRVSLTVAENAQPFLMDWISQIKKVFFWLSFSGIVLVGIEFGKKISSRKGQLLFSLGWIVLISGILFSRISSSSLFNGENLISRIFYLSGVGIFLIISARIYFKNKIDLNSTSILLASLMLISVIAVRSASRVFFLIVPLTCLSVSFFVFRIGEYAKKNKDELIKGFLFLLFILAIIGSVYSFYGDFNSTKNQAAYFSPSATGQWQEAMSWVRENTSQKSIFLHWWDYGYWVQYLGERTTITDGGHGNSFWDHLIGRYVLTTPKPETALSFMKAHNVSYLLIDQTDLGKYPAYSKIGGDENYDRFSIIGTGIVNDQQTTETADTIKRIYTIGVSVDEDIIYEGENGQKIFIPGPVFDKKGQANFKAYLAGVIIESSVNGKTETFKQPQGVFIYNNQQIPIPLKYIYANGKIFDFGKGLDSVVYIFPKISQNSAGGISVDTSGAVIYLSPKVSKSLFAQLYLLGDAFENYPTLKEAHSESDYIVKSLRSQGLNLGEFVYFQGFRGPIKIWEVNYPEEIVAYEGFTNLSGGYAKFDDLEFK